MKFKIPQKLRLSTLLYNKKFAIGLSIVLAFSLWLGIAMTENPIRERTFNDIKATVSLDGTAVANDDNLRIISDHSSQTFSITVSGPNYVVSSLKAEDFSLTASVVDVTGPGRYSLKLIAQVTSNKSGFTITSISPSTISVDADYFDNNVPFDVIPSVIGAHIDYDKGLIKGNVSVYDTAHEKIEISGPRSEIEKISRVEAVATVDKELSATETFDADIVIYGKEKNGTDEKQLYRFVNGGNTIYNDKNETITNCPLSLSFTDIKVTQRVLKEKVIPCVPVFNNMPVGMALEDIDYQLNCDEVTIEGPPDLIDEIEQISLSPIDFRDIKSGKNSFEVSYNTLPDSVNITDYQDTVFTVEIDLKNYTEKYITVSKVRFVGEPVGHTAKWNKSIPFRVCGPISVLKTVSSDDFYVELDLTGKEVGSSRVDAVVKSDVYSGIWQIGTYETTVTIS